MNNGLIATRYATALLEYANEKKTSERVYKEAKNISQSFFQFNGMRSTLDNPVLDKAEKRKIIELAAGAKASSELMRFIDLLLTNNREFHLQSIVLRYIDLYRKQMNIHSGKLITATVVSPETEARLLSTMQTEIGGTVEIDKHIDPEVLGGFVFEVDFLRMDASLAGQLKRIKNEYIEKNKRTV